MLGAIIPAVAYELYAPGTPFGRPAVLIDSPVIPPGTTGQEERQIRAANLMDQEESVVLKFLEKH